jgi:thiol-disulfide isomerase/thioredoxin
MKRILPWAMTLLLVPGFCMAQKDALLPVQPASEFNLEAYHGQVVLLDFWASWCAPCKQSMPWLSKMQEQYGDRGLQIVAVNLDGKLNDAAEMLATLDPGIRVVHDPNGKLAELFNLEGMPSAYLHDRQGRLTASHVGFLPAEREVKEEQIRTLLEQEIPHDEK